MSIDQPGIDFLLSRLMRDKEGFCVCVCVGGGVEGGCVDGRVWVLEH